MAKRSSNAPWLYLAAALAAGGALAWWYYRKPAAKPPELRIAKVSKGEIVQAVTANGQLSPVVTVQLGSQVSGNIQKLYVDFNSKVTNGQLVAELEPSTYEARLIQAESELINAKAQANLARVNAKRADLLFKGSLISEADSDQAKAELEQRDANVRIRDAALKSAQIDLARTKIYSPIDGTVISRNVSVGQTVQASFTAPTLFNVAQDLRKMEIAAMVSEADIGGVEEGQSVSFLVDAFPARTFVGRVSQVRNEPTTNQNVVTYATIVDVPNADLKLKPGMTANVSITLAKKSRVLKIANTALRFRPPETITVKTNTIFLASSKTNATSTAQADDGLPAGIPPEMRQRMLERYDKDGDGKLNDAEKKEMEEARKARAAASAAGGGGGGRGFGGGGAGGFGGGGRGGGDAGFGAPRTRPEVPQVYRTVYLVSTNMAAAGKPVELQPVQVKTGITDGSFTEIEEGLKEGDIVATGATVTESQNALSPNRPNNPFGGGRRF